MSKETIKLSDFTAEYAKIDKAFAKEIKPTYDTHMKCPECNKTYSLEIQFCSKDGKKLKKEKYQTRSRESQEVIRNLFYDFQNGLRLDEFSYEFEESQEVYDEDHSGDSYFIDFIFKRKSDGKFFEFTIDSNGELDGDHFYEVQKKTKTKTTWE